MNTVTGGVCAPKGYTAAGVTANIKGVRSEKKDCALIVSDAPASVAGVFTTNRVQAAPVQWCRDVCAAGTARAVFANSGNANACTGQRGLDDTRATAAMVAEGLGAAPGDICVLSTGVIGVPMPMDRVANGVRACLEALSPEGGADAARAIMTTDTVPKERSVEIALPGGTVRIGAIAKGAGMISPNVATMLCVIVTDAEVAAADLQALLRASAEVSFNCMCVDNDMSTNDTVLVLANGRAGLPRLEPGTPGYDAFAAAFTAICVDLAQALVRDGEGAKKFVTIEVGGAPTDAAARTIAKSIAQSQLCKTAFAGEDPNWGRIGCAAGYAGVAFDQRDLSIWIGDVAVVEQGLPTNFVEADVAAIMQRTDVPVRVQVGPGSGKATFWTCDLTHDYVTINADYRT